MKVSVIGTLIRMSSHQRWRSPRLVLIADDSPVVRRALARMLMLRGYAVVYAASGDEAVAATHDHDVAAVLLDLGMPGMSGAQVISTLHEQQPRPAVVLMSGTGFPADLGFPAEPDARLTKPFTHEALFGALDRLLDARWVPPMAADLPQIADDPAVYDGLDPAS